MKTPWWFTHKTPIACLLVPVSWVYYAASRIVYFIRGFRSYKSRRPVICVGNILAGGVVLDSSFWTKTSSENNDVPTADWAAASPVGSLRWPAARYRVERDVPARL